MSKFLLVSLTLLAVASYSAAQSETPETSEILAGHSYHGEAFNEGPRQKPYLMSGLGRANFAISTDDEQAQAFFNQGVDQLHGFWYFEAERSFRQVAMLDNDCAMAYWGLAMANLNNEDRARDFIGQAKDKLSTDRRTVTPRETKYIEALAAYYDEKVKEEKRRAENMTKKLEEIVLEYPEDIEAKAFLACQVWMNRRQDINIASHVGINSILQDVFEADPNHPAHHYRIHLWDYENPEIALHSAAMCGPSLPDIAHMWHMPGHIYSRLKRYEDAVWQQEASARVDHRNMMHDWVLPDQIHNFAHNNEWCIRNLIHVGRVSDAIELANNMLSLPRHPKYNMLNERGSSRYGRQRLFQVFSTYEMWNELIAACHSSLLETDGSINGNIKRLRFLGRAYYRSGDTENGQHVLRQLEEKLARIEDAKSIAKSEAETAVHKQSNRFKWVLAKFHNFVPAKVQNEFDDQSKRSLRRDHRTRLKEQVAKSVKRYDDQINIAKRAIDELKGHEHFANQEYEEALKSLKKAGEVDAIYRAYVKHLSGETDSALEDARKYVETRVNEVQPLANLAWLLWECEQYDEAVQTFCELCGTSSSIDTEAKFFAKLDPILKHTQVENDWCFERKLAADVGERPELDSLGPFRWQPLTAPSWQLLDSNDELVSLSDFAGQPVIVIFYLGHGCLHCAEQLQAFAPKLDDFLDQGIEVIAISTDKRNGLKKSIDSYGEQPLPIRLLANPELTVFKKYRAFDEFEDQALHGTFLIDNQGRIRWQDISYEPFMDPEFLLSESQRLLGQAIAR